METTATLATIVTGNLLNGVLNEVVALIPVVFPPMITFIGLRKGISFVRGILESA